MNPNFLIFFSASSDGFESEESYLIPEENYKKILDEVVSFDNKTIRGVMTYTNKLNSKNTFQAGGIFSHQKFNFKAQEYDATPAAWEVYLNNSGKSQLIQTYAHWKHRFDEKWTLNSGFHYTYFALNGSQSLEPRLALKWKRNPKQAWSAAIGLHSKPEHIAFYFAEIQRK